MSTDYARAVGANLRIVRERLGLSLTGVERKSGGRWKGVVIGAYERNDRGVTIAKLAELAAFYGVTVPELLPDAVPAAPHPDILASELLRDALDAFIGDHGTYPKGK